MRLHALFLAVAALSPAALSSQEWSRFRGPNGSGQSDAEGIPVSWGDDGVLWKARLPGKGHAQPVLWGETLFVTSATSGEDRVVVALNAASGTERWQRSFTARTHTIHERNSFASGTAAVDAERLYVVIAHSGSVGVRALSHDGKDLWNIDLGPYESRHGHASSPIRWGELLILANEHGDDPGTTAQSFVVALEASTGTVRWKTPRRSESVSYSTPCVLARSGGRSELVCASEGSGLYGLDAATGEVAWEAGVFSMRTVSSPVLCGDLAIGTCGSGGGGNYLVAVRAEAVRAGALPAGGGASEVYRLKKSIPYVPTPIVKGDRLFLWGDKGGIVSCADARTGSVLWQERVGGDFSGSPVCVRDRLYAISERGEVVVVAAADEFKVLGRTQLGEPSRSTPAVAGGRMFLRTESHITAVGSRPSPTAPGG